MIVSLNHEENFGIHYEAKKEKQVIVFYFYLLDTHTSTFKDY